MARTMLKSAALALGAVLAAGSLAPAQETIRLGGASSATSGLGGGAVVDLTGKGTIASAAAATDDTQLTHGFRRGYYGGYRGGYYGGFGYGRYYGGFGFGRSYGGFGYYRPYYTGFYRSYYRPFYTNYYGGFYPYSRGYYGGFYGGGFYGGGYFGCSLGVSPAVQPVPVITLNGRSSDSYWASAAPPSSTPAPIAAPAVTPQPVPVPAPVTDLPVSFRRTSTEPQSPYTFKAYGEK